VRRAGPPRDSTDSPASLSGSFFIDHRLAFNNFQHRSLDTKNWRKEHVVDNLQVPSQTVMVIGVS
jgi:hypothetical protein